jgi:hypothetical protein
MKTRAWNPLSLRFRLRTASPTQVDATRMEDGGWRARIVLECGSPLPLLSRSKDSALQSARGLAQSKTWRIFGALLTFLAITISVRAQSYSIDWYKIAGGGGTSTGDVYAVSGTIGQPDAGMAMSGGNYSLTGGFWSIISVVQTPGLPLLTITLNPQLSTVTVSWPNTGSYTLQQNNNLAGGSWGTSGYTITTSNGTNSIIVTPPTGNLFFRLKQ